MVLNPAHEAAEQFARKHSLCRPVVETVLDRALAAENIEVVDAPADLPVPEVRRGNVIGIRLGESHSWRKWLKAHALGHYLLHRGDQFENCDKLVLARQERQADLFAGWLLIGSARTSQPAWELAEQYGVPTECVEGWLEATRTTREAMV